MKGSDLVAVPYKNESFCRIKERKLIVLVKNQGDDPADSNTHTKVSFGDSGVYGEKELPTPTLNLKKTDPPLELEFECPNECFVPDCMFYITVDSKKELTNEKIEGDYDNTFNNLKKGICFEKDKPFLPDLIPEKYDDTKTYYKRVGNSLKVQIRNQGTAIAGKSKTEVKFENLDKPTVNMGEMDPGELKEISVTIPVAHHTGDFRFKITADVEDKVEESNEDNNVARDTFIEAVLPL